MRMSLARNGFPVTETPLAFFRPAGAVSTNVGQVTQTTAAGPARAPVEERSLDVRWRGRVDYQAAWDEQRELHARRMEDEIGDTVLLLEHPSVFTAGKRTEEWQRPNDGTPVVEVDRGGLITWHGPGQLVGYPIVRLPKPLDVVAYVRRMEKVLIDVCAELGVHTIPIPERTGVWVPADDRGPARKIAAIGVRVRWAVTMHGFALNCDNSFDGFNAIVPCGIVDAEVTSLSKELGRDVTLAEVTPLVERHLPKLLA